ncbi:hypothetical protein LSCM1_01827 [Leishmania martiniquensis]|uniref:Uncharacterized protein n=1 Tax=Leishmania martiniquensis TaxID=1580590 RepID=A0A836GVH9_9TRYP|nr:hypothetical protein LSCM1_01827 [Leishmania martiniquensis]
MRGNPYSRGFDPMKSRSERRKEKQAKVAKSKRAIRLKKRLGRIAARKFAGQEDSHMTALMESYILRRKAERAAAKAKNALQDGTGALDAAHSPAKKTDVEESEMDDGEGSEDFSLGSVADSAFEMDSAGDDDDGRHHGISTTQRRPAPRKEQGEVGSGSRERRGSARGRGLTETTAKKDITSLHGKRVHGSTANRGREGARGAHAPQRGGRDSGRLGETAQQRQNLRRSARVHERPCKVPTRTLY